MVAALLLELHQRQETILIVVTHSARPGRADSPCDTNCVMRTSTLLARNLAWYWRTNLAVLLGVATATGVLGGALLVGDSVRASLRDLVLARLGNADSVVTAQRLLPRGAGRGSSASAACPLIADGRASWRTNERPARRRRAGLRRRRALLEIPGRARRAAARTRDPADRGAGAGTGRKAGRPILLRVEKPSAIPLESLHGRKEDVGKTIRLTMSGVAAARFSLRPQQGDVRAVYVPLARLQRDLDEPGKVNTHSGGRSDADIARAT